MRKGTFKYIEQMISDYHKYDALIKNREDEIWHPYREHDDNTGGSSGGRDFSKLERMASALIEDAKLDRLRKEKRAMDKAFRESRPGAETVITMWYLTKPRLKTWDGVAEEVKWSRRTCINLRDEFIEIIADELGLS